MVKSRLTPRAKGTLAPPRRFAWAQVGVAVVLPRARRAPVSAAGDVGRLLHAQERRQLRQGARAAGDARADPRSQGARARRQPARVQRLHHAALLQHRRADQAQEATSRSPTSRRRRSRSRSRGKRGLDRFRQLLAFEDITRDEMALLESEKNDLPGVAVQAVAHRNYPHGSLAAHVARLHEPDHARGARRQAAARRHAQLSPRRLRRARRASSGSGSRSCAARTASSASSSTPRGSARTRPELEALLGGPQRSSREPGNDLVTSIDLDLQKATETALAKHKSGAAAVVEVDTGRVLALASWPEPDPNVLTGRLSRAESAALNERSAASDDGQDAARELLPRLDLQDRADDRRRSRSTWSIPRRIVTCHGGLRFGKRMLPLRRDARQGEPALRARRVVQRLLLRARRRRSASTAWRAWPHDLGFGAADRARAQRRGRRAWCRRWTSTSACRAASRRASLLNTAIGQGDDQGDRAAGGDGLRRDRQRRQAVGAADRRARADARRRRCVQEFAPRLRRQIAASADTLQKVRSALYDAVNHRPEGHQLARARARARRRRQDRHGAGRQEPQGRRRGRREQQPLVVRQLRAVARSRRSRSWCSSSTAASAPRRRRRRRWRSTRATSTRSTTSRRR